MPSIIGANQLIYVKARAKDNRSPIDRVCFEFKECRLTYNRDNLTYHNIYSTQTLLMPLKFNINL